MRTRRGGQLTDIIILILLALACSVVAWRQESWGEGVRILIMLTAVLFLALAIFAAITWIQYNLAVVAEARNKAGMYSERVALLAQISQMNPEQLELVNSYVPVVDLIVGDHGPLQYLRITGGQSIPLPFIEKYINLGTANEFYSIRNLTSKSEQAWAMQFIDYATMMGWAQKPAGNQPAKWLDYNRAVTAIWGEG